MRTQIDVGDMNQYYLAVWTDDSNQPMEINWTFGKQVADVFSFPAGIGGPTGIFHDTVVDGTKFRVEINGSVMKLFFGGVQIGTVTDTDIDGLSTFQGVSVWQYVDVATDITLDNFRAGNVPAVNTHFQHAFTGTIEFNLTGGERSVAVSEAVTFTFGAWLSIDLDDGTQFITRVPTESDSPTFLLPLTTAFPAGQLASAGNTFHLARFK